MRSLGKAVVIVAILFAGPWAAAAADGSAGGQTLVWRDGRWIALPANTQPAARPDGAKRWGGTVDGRWRGGAQAPGGWAAYRALHRGDRLPGYWRDPAFVIGDYLVWGLAAPPGGYHWVRYYDDAVLISDDGQIWNSVGGIAWGDAGGAEVVATTSAPGAGYAVPGSTPAQQPVPPTGTVAPGVVWGGAVPPGAIPLPVVQGAAAQGTVVTPGTAPAYVWGTTGTSVTVIQLPPVITRTTTVVEEEVVEEKSEIRTVTAARRAVRRRARPKPKPRPVCRTCSCSCR